jgi:hypothetical protein
MVREPRSTCISPVCDRPTHSWSMCAVHASRFRRTGNPRLEDAVRVPPPSRWVDRFWSKVGKSDGCWTWTGRHSGTGYGVVTVHNRGRRDTSAHRVAYELTHGPVPEGMHLDHFACDNRGCCNPDHVRPVTPRENTLRSDGTAAWFLARQVCAKGHPFAGENLALRPSGDGRKCRRCHAEYMVEYRKQGRQKKRRAT